MNDGNTYSLPIQNGYASGPNAVGNASDGTNSFDFALTHNGDNLTGPYNSSFMGNGTVASPGQNGGGGNGGGGNGGDGGGGGGGCFISTINGK